MGEPNRKAIAHKVEATRRGAAEKSNLEEFPFRAGGGRYKVVGRQNYRQGNGVKGLWLERNLGRSTSSAARPGGRWDPRVKCYLVQKQSCA